MKKVITLCCAALLLPSFVFGPLPVWEKPSQVVLEGDQGNRVNGGSWSSDELVGAVHVLFYVDPDESDLNNAASDALKAEDFDKEQYRSVAIINMDATWLPNAVIQMRLESKQEEYPPNDLCAGQPEGAGGEVGPGGRQQRHRAVQPRWHGAAQCRWTTHGSANPRVAGADPGADERIQAAES